MAEECDTCQGYSWEEFQRQLAVEKKRDDIKRLLESLSPVIIVIVILLLMMAISAVWL